METVLVLQRRFQGGRSILPSRRVERRLSWERRARSLRSCVSSSYSSNSSGPNCSRGSISRTTRHTCGLVIRGIFFPPILLQGPAGTLPPAGTWLCGDASPPQLRVSYSSIPTSPFSVSNSVSIRQREPPTYARSPRLCPQERWTGSSEARCRPGSGARRPIPPRRACASW